MISIKGHFNLEDTNEALSRNVGRFLLSGVGGIESLWQCMFYNRSMATATQLLATKLYVPPLRPKIVSRPRLLEQLNDVLTCRLTLISAPAGFGKTTLVSESIAGCGVPAVWSSLDEGDNDPIRFLTYLVAALRTVAPTLGEGVLEVLEAAQSQPPQIGRASCR